MPITYNPTVPSRGDVWSFQGWQGMAQGVGSGMQAIAQALAEKKREEQERQSLLQLLSPGTPSQEVGRMPWSPTAPGAPGFDAEQSTIWGEETGAEVPETVKNAAKAAKAYRDILASEYQVPKEALATMGIGQLRGVAARMQLQRQDRKEALENLITQSRLASTAASTAYTEQLIRSDQERQRARQAEEERMTAFQKEIEPLSTPSVAPAGQVGLIPGLQVPGTAMMTPLEANPAESLRTAGFAALRTGVRNPEVADTLNAMARLSVPEKPAIELQPFTTPGGKTFWINQRTGATFEDKGTSANSGQWTVEKLPDGTPTGYYRDPEGKIRPVPNQKQLFDYRPFDKNGNGFLDQEEWAAALTAYFMSKQGGPYPGMPVAPAGAPGQPAAKRFIWDRDKGDWK